jgi:post-segregation antitoxin (ccd killing protein)
MRKPSFDAQAPKQTVSITLNSDLYAKARGAGINASRVAEEAIADAYRELERAKILAEIQQDLAAADQYAEEHGSLSELVRAHYERQDDAV